MEIDVINTIRNGLKKELESYEGAPARLRLRSDIAEIILFIL